MDYRFVRERPARRGRERRVDVLLADAETRWQAGDAPGAMDVLDQALALRPDHRLALILRGGVQAALTRFAAAETDYRRALALGPADAALLFGFGQTLQAQKKFAEARTAYDALLRHQPDHVAALHERATVTADLGELGAALALYDAVLTHDPGSVPGLVNRALLRVERGPWIRRIDLADLERAVRIAPANALLRCHAALAQRLAGDAAAAVAHYLAASRVDAAIAPVREAHDYALDQPPEVVLYGERFRVLELALRAAQLDGFVAEFGVYRGASLDFIAARHVGPVDGFDSFEGLPAVWTATDGKGKYSTDGALPTVPPHVRLVVGGFAASLPRDLARTAGPARFIHIDCDLYASTATVLELLAPRIEPGTVIVFDEYFGYAGWAEHEFRAFAQLVAARGLRYRYLALNPFAKQAAVAIS
jgi:tetratricopeptide (TPR) repeat protein